MYRSGHVIHIKRTRLSLGSDVSDGSSALLVHHVLLPLALLAQLLINRSADRTIQGRTQRVAGLP